MNTDDRKLVALIRQAVPQVGGPPPAIDLRARLEHRLLRSRTSLSRLDWILAALGLFLLAGFPEAVTLVLYQL